jgi:transcription elongation factor Elf1
VGDRIDRCILCRSDNISTTEELERIVTARCGACGAVVRVEFDPPDAPRLRGRIEILVDPAGPQT